MRGNIVESFNNKPNITNIRNDWSIWGVMKGVSGVDIPIHLRYAIDEMPTSYRSVRSGILFASSNSIVATEPTAQLVDWRELIYQMAWDNAKYQSHIEELTYALYNGYVHYDINKINTEKINRENLLIKKLFISSFISKKEYTNSLLAFSQYSNNRSFAIK